MQIRTNSENLENHKKYLQIEEAVHEFMKKKDYLKIGLPVLSPALIPESYLEVFQTVFTFLDKRKKMYLTPSPELFLKRLLVNRIGSCYYLGKAFRNSEPDSERHSPEFTMLEYYKVKADYMDVGDELLEMLQFINIKCQMPNDKFKSKMSKIKKHKLVYCDKKISLEKWEKLTVAQAFEKYSGITENQLFNHNNFIAVAKKKGYKVEGFSYEDTWSQIYSQEVEPHLGTNGCPTLIYDYPKEFAALAKLNEDNKTTQRFEFYIAGIELGDCYTELTDWKEQEMRFKIEDAKRAKEKKIQHPIDKGFIEALKYGLGPCAGIAIGFERLAMIFADCKSIDELKLINIK